MLLLAHGQADGGVELPAHPQFGEAVVGGLEIAAADRLRMDGEVVDQAGLEAEADAPAFEAAVGAADPAGVMVVAVVAAQ